MSAPRTARARARAEITQEIVDAGRRQLATDGAAGLSLRAIARELGMVSSAVYRYFPSRDDLLTTLIVEAYDALGDAAEAADDDPAAPAPTRLRRIGRAVRCWARAHPHEYALVYGSPVPGYRAPFDTVRAALRVQTRLVEVLALHPPERRPASVSEPLASQLAAVADRLPRPVPPALLARGMTAWNLLIGSVSLELFGHYANSVDDLDALFECALDGMLELVGWSPDPGA
ncbi:MAG: TetR/AcrR family transcriptional regulator [Acidimicrobiales bacterium]